VGLFKNAGSCWEQSAVRVNDHDFRSLAEGIAIPYGIYDPLANRGAVFVGYAFTGVRRDQSLVGDRNCSMFS
jgi:hypothetical protein